MQEQIVLIGAGNIHSTLAGLAREGYNDVVVVSPEEAKKLSLPEKESFILKNPNPPKLGLYGVGKEFICKGKHQYSEKEIGKDKVWVCQCGRKIND